MLTKLEFAIFITFFATFVLFFEHQVSTWAIANNITTVEISQTAMTEDALTLNTRTNSSCYFEGIALLTGRKFTSKHCPILGFYSECANLEPSCGSGQISVEVGSVLNIVPSDSIISFLTLGTQDTNLLWLNSVLFFTITVGVTVVIVEIIRGVGG